MLKEHFLKLSRYFPIISAIVLLASWFVFTNSANANSYTALAYDLNLTHIKAAILQVEITLQGNFKNQLVLDLPCKWANASYAKQIKNIKTIPKYPIDLIRNDQQAQAIISLPKQTIQQLKITYEVQQKTGNPSDVHEAIIRDNLVHTPGYGIFSTPADLKNTQNIDIKINWLDLNQEWATISSYGIAKSLVLNTSISQLLEAIYVAGKIRIYQIGAHSQPVFLSLYGDFSLADQEIASDLGAIINSQRTFFKDFAFPYYAISLIENDNSGLSGGTKLANSFTAFLPKKIRRNNYYLLFAHEHLHNWLGDKIPNHKDEELNYWWTEGFTEFYARLIALRAKGIDRDTFITEMNHFLRAYYLSPVNLEPNLTIKKDFWHNYAIQKLPYYRGLVFAIYLNNLIKKQNHRNSLDNIIDDLYKIRTKEPFSATLFKNLARKYLTNGIDKPFLNFIDQGQLIPLADITLPLEKVLIGRYDLGFNRESLLQDKQIKEIDSTSNAYKAGLRNGQKILSFDIPNGTGDPEQIITIQTADKIYQFKPEHDQKREVYQLKTKLSATEIKEFNEFFTIK